MLKCIHNDSKKEINLKMNLLSCAAKKKAKVNQVLDGSFLLGGMHQQF